MVHSAADQAIAEVRTAIDEVKAERGEQDLASVSKLINAADRLAMAAEAGIGSCERGRPFAGMFIVARPDGSLVWRCQHNPPHPDIAS